MVRSVLTPVRTNERAENILKDSILTNPGTFSGHWKQRGLETTNKINK